jgi:CHASE2 domain-containing sensor protein
LQKKFTRLILVFIALVLSIGSISYFRLLDSYELIFLDLRFKSRPIQKINPQIAIIEIGNDTLTNLGRWPLPRDYHASLIKVLSDCGVSAIIFDVLFSEPSRTDDLLVEASKQAGCVYYPYALGLEGKSGNLWQGVKFDAELLPALKNVAKGTGFANVLTDIDGKRRRIPLFISYQDKVLPQLSLKAACDYLRIKPEQIKIVPRKFVQLSATLRIPIDEETATLVNLAGGWKDTFKHYSYYDILFAYANKPEGPKGQDLPQELAELKDKVCFVGLTATGTADLNPTAIEPVYPMVGLHANLFNSIVTKSFLTRLPPLVNLVFLYLLCLVSVFLTVKTRPLIGVLYQLGLLLLFTTCGFLLFILAGLWMDLFFPIVVCISVYLGTNIFRYIKELQTREVLEKELSVARNIQRSFLKEVPQEVCGVGISVAMNTAHHVGGDLYDFVQFADGRIGLMVGDVSGKGVPAALFMAQVISKFRYFANICSTPAQTLKELNQDISRESKSGLFVTMAYLIYNPANRALSLASGGHLPALIFRNSQLLEKIEVSEGIPLGLMEGADFTQQELSLTQEDIVLLYTDGVTEAWDKKGREFGEQGIIQALTAKHDLSSQQTVQALKSSIGAFVGRTPQHDDITIMVLKSL